jgi:hypothetical protein
VCLKNICDGVGGQDESNGTPLDPPLFWLDNIFEEPTKTLCLHLRDCGILSSTAFSARQEIKGTVA